MPSDLLHLYARPTEFAHDLSLCKSRARVQAQPIGGVDAFHRTEVSPGAPRYAVWCFAAGVRRNSTLEASRRVCPRSRGGEGSIARRVCPRSRGGEGSIAKLKGSEGEHASRRSCESALDIATSLQDALYSAWRAPCCAINSHARVFVWDRTLRALTHVKPRAPEAFAEEHTTLSALAQGRLGMRRNLRLERAAFSTPIFHRTPPPRILPHCRLSALAQWRWCRWWSHRWEQDARLISIADARTLRKPISKPLVC
eukprot:scaffold3579_cov30-Tisochrysis_lutea.AAC.2